MTLQSSPNLKHAVPFFMVTDMERSLEFYVTGLGFQIRLDWKPNGKIEWCWLERDGVSLMLQEYRPGLAPKEKLGEGVSICFVCSDALKLYDEFLQKRVAVSEPFVGIRMWVVSLRDPDGYKIQF
jgi:lactoylglutathione lyase